MPKLIVFSCFMLFWVFYEMSGGADFAPRERVVISQAPFGKPALRNETYTPPATPSQVVNASYVPVETHSLAPAVIPQPTQQPVPTVETAPLVATFEAVAPVEPPVRELRYVAGTRVNLRVGPGTNHPVLDTLPQGTAAELITMNAEGWAQIRLIDTDTTGWMAARLLSED